MKEKKRKGFTMIELLATVVILGIVMSIAGYIVFRVINNAKEKSYQVTIKEIESKADSYLMEHRDRLFFLTNSEKNYEYQCITVQNLIDYGYLKDTIEVSKVSANKNVSKNDYVYIERNIETKAIEKTVYNLANDKNDVCDIAVRAVGDIAFVSVPDNNTWSKTKNITITYILKNLNDLNTLKDYEYNYSYSGSSTLVSDNNQKKEIRVSTTGTVIGNIVNGGNNITSGSFEVLRIDNTGPTVASEYSGANTVSNSVTIPLKASDVGVGFNQDSFTKDDLIVKIGGANITNFSLTNKGNDLYNLVISNVTNTGEVVITILANKIEDKLGNSNEEIVINTGITVNLQYTVSFDANGGSTPSPTSKVVTYGETYGALATTVKSSYDFGGWYTAASGGSLVTPNTTVTITGDQTLYAHWSYKTPTYTPRPSTPRPSTPSTPTPSTPSNPCPPGGGGSCECSVIHFYDSYAEAVEACEEAAARVAARRAQEEADKIWAEMFGGGGGSTCCKQYYYNSQFRGCISYGSC